MLAAFLWMGFCFSIFSYFPCEACTVFGLERQLYRCVYAPVPAPVCLCAAYVSVWGCGDQMCICVCMLFFFSLFLLPSRTPVRARGPWRSSCQATGRKSANLLMMTFKQGKVRSLYWHSKFSLVTYFSYVFERMMLIIMFHFAILMHGELRWHTCLRRTKRKCKLGRKKYIYNNITYMSFDSQLNTEI